MMERDVTDIVREDEESRFEELAPKVEELDLLTACKGALAALSQPATFPGDIALAKRWLTIAIGAAEGRP